MAITIKKLKEAMRKPEDTSSASIPPEDFVSTGSTLLNLACSGKTRNGFARGHYYNVVGDSDTGKTFISLTCLAEASINPEFDDYRFIHDNPEGGALMDIRKFFGPKVLERLEPPNKDEDGEPLHSRIVEEFYDNLDRARIVGQPYIYILDSMDVLDTADDEAKANEQKNARVTGKKVAGSFGTSKAKLNKQYLRKALKFVQKSKSILIIISQTSDKIGFGFGDKKYKSGGHALKFFCALEIWLSLKEKIKKSVKLRPGAKPKDRLIGVKTKVRIKRNRITGRDRTIFLSILNTSGIDDMGSCIDFLTEEGYWGVVKGQIKTEEFDFKGNKEELIQHIQSKNLEDKLRRITGKVWREIEKSLVLERKSKYE